MIGLSNAVNDVSERRRDTGSSSQTAFDRTTIQLESDSAAVRCPTSMDAHTVPENAPAGPVRVTK